MSVATRSLGAAVLFCGVLTFAWLAPGPSDDFEISANTAYAGAAKTKTRKKVGGSAAAKKHHVRVKADLAKLKAVRKNLASTPVHFGGHREKALQEISHAIHQLTLLERHLRKHK